MAKVRAGTLTIGYERQGSGEPLILIPHLAADRACYAFQVPDYAKHFSCVSVDLRDSGESDRSASRYTTQTLADDVAALMQSLGIEKAHVSGLSLGAAVGLWLAAKHPQRVRSLSLHSAWPATDPSVKTVVGSWQVMARALDSVTEMLIEAIFPWCLTPELYANRPDYVQSLADFVRGRPAQPVDAFLRQSDAVITHDATDALPRILAPTQITFGRHDAVTSTRFAGPLQTIRGSELHVFENCSHAPIYEDAAAFNEATLRFLRRSAAGTP
jgi:pimeloyl-ACP methyl ester carboxylesterase